MELQLRLDLESAPVEAEPLNGLFLGLGSLLRPLKGVQWPAVSCDSLLVVELNFPHDLESDLAVVVGLS